MKAVVRFISASVMRFKKASSKLKTIYSLRVFSIPFCLLFFTSHFLLFTSYFSVINADYRDRVVAYVDNDVITLSELEERYAHTLEIAPDITRDEVLHTMVNRLLLLREAKKIKLEVPSEDALIKEYIDLKVKAFIRIKEEEIVDFYNQNKEKFQEKELETVREDIENILTEKALNERLKSHIEDLKENACVKIQLYE